MTLTLTFEPEVEAGLLARAQARGMDLQQYLHSLVEQDVLPPSQKAASSEATGRHEAVRRMLEFGRKYSLSLGEPVARASLHEGHRF
jgi:hypothetical protein